MSTGIPSYYESVSGRLLYDVKQFRNGPAATDREMGIWEKIGRRSVAELTFLVLPVFAIIEMVARVALALIAIIGAVTYLTVMQNCCSDGVRESLSKAFESDSLIAKISTGICMGPLIAGYSCYQLLANFYEE